MEDAERVAFEGAPAEIIREYRLEMGTDLEFFSVEVSDFACVMVLLICGVALLLAGALVTKYMRKSDR